MLTELLIDDVESATRAELLPRLRQQETLPRIGKEKGIMTVEIQQDETRHPASSIQKKKGIQSRYS